MTSGRFWRRFWRQFNWDACYKNRCDGMLQWLTMEKRVGVRPPPTMIEMNARMLLEACHRGRWRAVWANFKDACHAQWGERYADKWEWIRTKIFRRERDPDIVLAERLDEEESALDEVVNQL